MHKLMEYICEEMGDLERKVDKEGKLSASEVQYLDMLAHTKKNLLKAEEMSDEEGYSGNMGGYAYADGGRRRNNRSYARGRGGNVRRDSRGRYSYEFKADLEELMQDAPNERVKTKLREVMQEM